MVEHKLVLRKRLLLLVVVDTITKHLIVCFTVQLLEVDHDSSIAYCLSSDNQQAVKPQRSRSQVTTSLDKQQYTSLLNLYRSRLSALWTLVALLVELICMQFKCKYLHKKSMPVWLLFLIIVKKGLSWSPGLECSYGEIFVPVMRAGTMSHPILLQAKLSLLIIPAEISGEKQTSSSLQSPISWLQSDISVTGLAWPLI